MYPENFFKNLYKTMKDFISGSVVNTIDLKGTWRALEVHLKTTWTLRWHLKVVWALKALGLLSTWGTQIFEAHLVTWVIKTLVYLITGKYEIYRFKSKDEKYLPLTKNALETKSSTVYIYV